VSEQNIRTVTSATGTYAVLPAQVIKDVSAGKSNPEAGKNVPVAEPPQPDLEELTKALNVGSQSIGRDLRFEVDMESGHSVIQVLDRETGEVIRQIPPEKARLSIAGNGSMRISLYNEHV
jgi:flagellar protein FlaG